MAFTLTHIRTGQQRIFTLRDILELLGDPINDEIIIHGECYRIKNVQGDLSSGSSGGFTRIDWRKYIIQVVTSGQSSFPINLASDDPEGLFLVVNGTLFDYGVDSAFHISNNTLLWHGRFNLEPTDIIYIKYLTLSN